MTIKFLWGILLICLTIGAIVLATWGIPAPTAMVTKIISPSQFVQK